MRYTVDVSSARQWRPLSMMPDMHVHDAYTVAVVPFYYIVTTGLL